VSWPTTTIDEACSLVTDGTHYTPPDLGEGMPFLTVKDVTKDGRVDFSECSRISSEEFERADKGNSVPKRGDVLFSKDGTVGKVHVVNGNEPFAVLSSLAILRPEQNKLDSNYFGWILKSESCLDQASRNKTGSAIRRIILKDLKKVKFALPPLAEQKRIAGILDAADALRAKRREALAQLDTLLQSTFLDMFGDPEQWSEISVSALAKAGRGTFSNGPFGSNLLTSELTKSGVPVIYIRDIRNAEYKRVSKVCVTEEKAAELKTCQTLPGDVLIAKVGDPPGVSAVYPAAQPLGIITQDVIRIRPELDAVNPSFLSGYLNSAYGKRKIREITVEATRARFGLTDFKKQKIPLPPVALQRRFAAMVESVEQQKTRMRSHLAELDALFASLQSRAFNGEL